MAKKETLTLEEIKKELSNKKDDKEKKAFLKDFIENKDYESIKRGLAKELAPIVTKKAEISYNLIYDSMTESLEPIYFWILDFMRDSSPGGLKLDVKKGPEEYEASVTSGYFGEMGQRASLMQQKAVEYLGTINNIIKSILNIIYDLKEFEIRLQPYNDLKDKSNEDKRSALHSLKGIWMDQVDARKGRGSINMLVQDLQFVTLRDAFFYVKDGEELEKKDIDLNARVKNILRRKLHEFNSWLDISEKEIRKRYEIEKIYLKSQAGTIKLYANWLKPYLIAAQRLKMRNVTEKNLTNPHIVNAFSNMEIEIKLYGKKEIKPAEVHESFSDIKLEKKYYAFIEVIMKFRSVPSALSGQGGRHYVHAGRTDIIFNAFSVDSTELEAIENQELYEDLELIDDYVGTSLSKLQEEIEKYTKETPEEKQEKKKEKSALENPFKGLFSGFKEVYDPLKETILKKREPVIIVKDLEKFTKEKAKDLTFTLYNTYKQTHGMLNL